MTSRPSARASFSSLGLVFTLAVLAWLRSLGSPFWLDDYLQLERSAATLVDPSALFEGFRFSVSDVTPLWLNQADWSVLYFRPLVNLLFLADWLAWGEWAGGYHLTNLLLHGVASLAWVLFVLEITGRPRIATLAGVIFAIHPSHQDTVGWISGRTDLVAAIPFFLAGVAHVRWRRGEGRIWLAPLLLALAFGAKESAAAFPAVVLLLEIYPGFGPRGRSPWRQCARALAPGVVVTLAYMGLRLAGGGFGNPGSAYLISPTDPTFLGVAVWRYLQYALNLAFLVPVDPVVVGPLLLARPLALLFLGLMLTAMGAWAWRWTGERRLLFFSAGFFFLTLAPSIPVVEGQRFLYLPSAGYALALALVLGALKAPWRRRALVGLVAGLGLACTAKTAFRDRLVAEAMAPIHALEAEFGAVLPADARLYFVDLPPLVCMGFRAAMRVILERDEVEAYALTLSPELPAAAGQWTPPVAGRTMVTWAEPGVLAVERVGGEYFSTFMERFFLWGSRLPLPGEVIRSEHLEVRAGAAGSGGGRSGFRFLFDDGLVPQRDWIFVCDGERIRRLELQSTPAGVAGEDSL